MRNDGAGKAQTSLQFPRERNARARTMEVRASRKVDKKRMSAAQTPRAAAVQAFNGAGVRGTCG